MSGTLTFLVLAIVGVGMAVILLVVIPRAIVSIYRYELWRIRDELFDQIYADEYHNEHQAELFLGQVEASIRVFPQLSLFNLVVLAALTHGMKPPVEPFDLSKMDASDREKIMPFVWRYGGASLKRIFWGSWSGLIALPFLLAFAALLSLGSLLRGGGAGVLRQFRKLFENRVNDKVLTLDQRQKPRGLASYV
jgi:hypothetical protein